MGKLISAIRNYPLSPGSVAYSNRMLLDNQFTIREYSSADDFRMLLEFSKDIYFFRDVGTTAYRWHDLLSQDSVFRYSRFLTIPVAEFHRFFLELPQINEFTADGILSEDEYATLAFQRFQLLYYLFSFYRHINLGLADDQAGQVAAILKSEAVSRFYIALQSLVKECVTGNAPLIKPANKKPVVDFKELPIPVPDDDLIALVTNYFNPSSEAGEPVLHIYNNAEDKLKAANEHAYSIFNGLLQIHQQFDSWARKRLHELTTEVNTHQPHISLLIAFCKLKSLFDARYNQLIASNTKFIYEKILQVEREPVLPDKALVAIELAKNVNQHMVERHSFFKAGKNSAGKPVYYQSTEDLVANGAKITGIRSMTRIYREGQLYSVMATHDAANPIWQVNNAWMPFNDISPSYTGIVFESKVLMATLKKDSMLTFQFTFSSNLPGNAILTERMELAVCQQADTWIALPVESVTITDNQLTVVAKIEKDLTDGKAGLNGKVQFISPVRDEADDESYALLYGFLLREKLSGIVVKLDNHSFGPESVSSASGLTDGAGGFMAFGSQSLAGASFRILHPLLAFSRNMTLRIEWQEALKENVQVAVANIPHTFFASAEASSVGNLTSVSSSMRVKLTQDVTYTIRSSITQGDVVSNVETSVPRVIMVKEVSMTADIAETIYTVEPRTTIIRRELLNRQPLLLKSLRMPFANKKKQKREIHRRHFQLRRRLFRERYNNEMAYQYPLGRLAIGNDTGITLLPDYNVLGFNDHVADLYIGLTDIVPGRTISLLFDIAEETADQSEQEAAISWWVISQDEFLSVDPTRVIDTTNNFLQSGIVRLTLPELATNSNSLVEGADMYWVVARCDKHCEVVANIRSISTNGLVVERVFDESNQEAKVSVAPGTIEQLFPKTANVKSVTQATPSSGGREAENDRHFSWRVSQRLRHKQRAIQQWDYEQLVLENFSNIYKVKCLNHAQYDATSSLIHAKAAHTVISVIPRLVVNPDEANFQPAVPLSRLLAIKSLLANKATAFAQLQVLNTQWDEISVQLEVVLQPHVLDIVYYRDRLNLDIKRYLSPWAFDQGTQVSTGSMYVTALVDYIDELPYVHHIRSLHVLKNQVEVFGEIKASSEIHLLTSAPDHSITAIAYGK